MNDSDGISATLDRILSPKFQKEFALHCVNTIGGLSYDDADEFASLAIASLWSKLAFKGGRVDSPDAYLRKAVTRQLLRKKQRTRPSSLDGTEPDESTDETPVEMVKNFERAELVRRAIEDLPLRKQIAVKLYHYQDRTLEQIAAVMQTSISTVCRLLQEARIDLGRDPRMRALVY